MRCLNLLSLTFCSLALAQTSGDFIAAILYGPEDYEFDIRPDRCVNLKRYQPIFSSIEVGFGIICKLHRDLKCTGEFIERTAGESSVEDVSFKSIYCEAEE